ncbi:MAG: exodeoxyribonuclease V subunit gamma [Deltaproteobacteria bacterium]|nr:exodeoxyribonuclease V subunit gamma [Deltaproteobacteria bacterium]
MPDLNLYTSNRLEILSEKLAEVLQLPLADPLQSEIIVVQSKGMERWVSMELARHLGICANIRFPFPNKFVFDVFRQIIPEVQEESLFEPRIMTWRLMHLLPACLGEKGFESLRGYLDGKDSDLKRFQLCLRIAHLFDQYLLFRPDLILAWDQGADDHWQANLWRRLVKGNEYNHRAALQRAFLEKIQHSPQTLKNLPDRISVFGISALPPFHLQVLAALSRLIEVNLFLMNPCREYWGDIFSDREMKRVTKRQKGGNAFPEELHLEKGNSLLASMGMLGRDFFDLITGLGCRENEFFADPAGEGLLAGIQSDILNLLDRGGEVGQKKAIRDDDISIQVCSCHSPMREAEVLQDYLLALFESDPSLFPKDILVMAPEIETYAPYIQAVFSLPANDPRWIPFSIADRGVRNESRLIDSFLQLLGLQGSRLGASEILAVLESPAVQRRLSLTEADLEPIQKWIRDTRIRWGIDENSRKELGLPPFSENTWWAGLKRMLLGYALPGQEEQMFMGILPYDRIEGEETAVLGNFLGFIEHLFEALKELGRERTLKEWEEFLSGLLLTFFLPNEETEREVQVIRRTLSDLAGKQDLSGFQEQIGLEVITTYLRTCLEQEGFGFGFLTGGLTFCAMLPMRSIPFKVICLMGMNDDTYPRQTRSLGFDLIAKNPRPGDRSRRKDDRYLFLEALLSARERFYISYDGQSVQDNSLRPPSVLVSELLDYIEQGYTAADQRVLDQIMTKHHLQAFSPEYFKENEKLFSYSPENFEAAQWAVSQRQDPRPFILNGLPAPPEEWKTIDLDQFCGFFENPARFFLRRRLGIYLAEEAGIPDENEPFDLSGIDRYQLEQDLVKKVLRKQSLKESLLAIKASGQLPHGAPGEWLFDQTCQGLDSFARTVLSYTEKGAFNPLEVDLSLDGFRLMGRIDQRFPDGIIHYRYARMRPQERLRLWIHLQVLNLMKAQEGPCQGILICKDKSCRVLPAEETAQSLKTLIDLYWQGLTRPLHFFPLSSWAFAESMEKHGDPEKAKTAARKTWEDEYGPVEKKNPYFQMCFGHGDPLDEEFECLAREIFGPLVRGEEKI